MLENCFMFDWNALTASLPSYCFNRVLNDPVLDCLPGDVNVPRTLENVFKVKPVPLFTSVDVVCKSWTDTNLSSHLSCSSVIGPGIINGAE